MRLCVWFLLISTLGFAAAKTHRELRADGDAAYQRKDYVAAHEAYAAALALRPDSPRYLHNLAATAALAGNKKEALETLHRLADLGIVTRVAPDQDFVSLHGTPEFADVLRALEANRAPRGSAELIAEWPDQTGIIEGIAWRESLGEMFFGDVHQRCVWRRDRAGVLTRFTKDDEKLLGIFGLVVDEKRGALWAATSALPEMLGFTPALQGRAALLELDLTTGAIRRIVPVPVDGHDHVLGDLVLAPDGKIYLTDSAAPIIWQFAPDAATLTKLVDGPEFASLQGLALAGRTLIVSDYANGLFTIDLGSLAVRALAPPPKTTLLGLDGLVAIPGGIVAIQNGTNPQRVLQIALTPDTAAITGVTVLASALPALDDLTLIARSGSHLAVVAHSGWDGFDPTKTPHPTVHPVRVLGIDPR